MAPGDPGTEANRFLGMIRHLVTRVLRNTNALSGQQKNPLTIALHHGLAGQKKLSSGSVEVTHLGRRAASRQSRWGSDPAIYATPRSCFPKHSPEHFPADELQDASQVGFLHFC